MIEDSIGTCGSCVVCDMVRPHEQTIHLVEPTALETVLVNVGTHIGNAGNTSFLNKITAGVPPGLRILIQIRERKGTSVIDQVFFWKVLNNYLLQWSILRIPNRFCVLQKPWRISSSL